MRTTDRISCIVGWGTSLAARTRSNGYRSGNARIGNCARNFERPMVDFLLLNIYYHGMAYADPLDEYG